MRESVKQGSSGVHGGVSMGGFMGGFHGGVSWGAKGLKGFKYKAMLGSKGEVAKSRGRSMFQVIVP